MVQDVLLVKNMKNQKRLFGNLGDITDPGPDIVLETEHFIDPLLEKYSSVDSIDMEHLIKSVISLRMSRDRVQRSIQILETEKSTMVENVVDN